MVKDKSVFVCGDCGQEAIKWFGQCPGCRAWNTCREMKTNPKRAGSAIRPAGDRPKPVQLKDIILTDGDKTTLPISGVNRVLGGGLMQGSIILVAGAPGVGKSTMLLAMLAGVKRKILYVSAEETLSQIKQRAERIGLTGAANVLFLGANNVEAIDDAMIESGSEIVIIDSIQTVYNETVPGASGSITQVREAAQFFQKVAKERNIAILLVGHITKGGDIAGPKLLEHIVDCVVRLDRESDSIRVLSASKNRFGSTREVAVFAMNKDGFKEILDPEGIFLEQQPASEPGSVVTAISEGTRVILVEIQILAVPTVFGYPRRVAVGVSQQRLEMILAVLERKARITLRNSDLYVKATAGLTAHEASADLAIALGLASAYKNKPISRRWCIFGEVGLLGEIKKPKDSVERQKAAANLGYNQTVQGRTIQEAIVEVFG
jgi:DNA repair protein RadA/Sms